METRMQEFEIATSNFVIQIFIKMEIITAQGTWFNFTKDEKFPMIDLE